MPEVGFRAYSVYEGVSRLRLIHLLENSNVLNMFAVPPLQAQEAGDWAARKAFSAPMVVRYRSWGEFSGPADRSQYSRRHANYVTDIHHRARVYRFSKVLIDFVYGWKN